MGDVLGLYTNTGVKVVEYSYDTWGVPTIVYDNSDFSLGTINPIRYRGYYYDSETKLYYLQSRYYNPEVGRFLNTDTIDVIAVSPTELTDKNLFSYCDNNPIIRADTGGEVWHIVAGGLIGGVSSFGATLITGGSIQEALISGGFGVLSGVLSTALPGASVLIDVAVGVVEEVTINILDENSSSESFTNTAISAGIDTMFSVTSDESKLTKETMQEFVEAIPKTTKGNHPRVKKSANRIVKKVQRTAARETGGAVVEKSASNFFKNILKAIF